MVGTIQRIADDLIHFAFIFCATYLSLAWLAHITFGSGDERFRTYGQALITQFDFFMGSFPENVLDDDYKFAFYVMLYVFLVSILALNFLLAFIVEGYTSVVEYTRQLQAIRKCKHLQRADTQAGPSARETEIQCNVPTGLTHPL